MKFTKSILVAIDRFLSALNAAFTAVPCVTLIMFLTLAVSIHMSLGRWPIVYHDNFPNGAINILDGLTVFMVMLLFASFPAWVVTATILVRPEKRRTLYNRALIYFVCFAVFIVICLLDPTGFFEWFMD